MTARFCDLSAAAQAAHIEETVAAYVERRNAADTAGVAALLAPDVVHYLPPGADGPWSGRAGVAGASSSVAASEGAVWVLERLLVERASLQAVAEWTRWRTVSDSHLRGDDWFRFDPETGLVTEIRSFHAASADERAGNVLEGYDYASAGFNLEAPVSRPHPEAGDPEPAAPARPTTVPSPVRTHAPVEPTPGGGRFVDLPADVRRRRIEETVRAYFDGCNSADVEGMVALFEPDAVHYFPPGIGGPWIGARTIAESWRHLVLTAGSAWAVEQFVGDPDTLQGVIEWTHWRTDLGRYVRGSEWYHFDPDTGRIAEIRALYAAQDDGRQAVELEGYDYAAAGFSTVAPVPPAATLVSHATTTTEGASS